MNETTSGQRGTPVPNDGLSASNHAVAGSHRSERIYIRVTPRERAAIVRRARAAGLSASEYVRRRSLVDGNRPVIATDPETLRVLYRDLRLAGSNLNQLAHEVHITHDPGRISPFLNAALTRVGSAAEAVSSFLADARNV